MGAVSDVDKYLQLFICYVNIIEKGNPIPLMKCKLGLESRFVHGNS